MENTLNIEVIKQLYPDEWVLLGNPINNEKDTDIESGIPLYHSKDKKEVCYLGRDKTIGYKTFTLFYTGEFRSIRTMGIFARISK
jgi:hypothetical protein